MEYKEITKLLQCSDLDFEIFLTGTSSSCNAEAVYLSSFLDS